MQELHEVVFEFDKFWGKLVITVDGVPVVKDLRLASLDLAKTYSFEVGTTESHQVVIEKRRERFFAGFRPQTVRAFVDGALVAEGVA